MKYEMDTRKYIASYHSTVFKHGYVKEKKFCVVKEKCHRNKFKLLEHFNLIKKEILKINLPIFLKLND